MQSLQGGPQRLQEPGVPHPQPLQAPLLFLGPSQRLPTAPMPPPLSPRACLLCPPVCALGDLPTTWPLLTLQRLPSRGAGATAAGLDATGASLHLLGSLCPPRTGWGTEEAGLAIPLSSLQGKGSDTHCQEGTRDSVPEERGFSEQPSQQLMHHLQAPGSPSCRQLSQGLPALCSAVRVSSWGWGWGWCPGTCMLLAN